MSYSAHARQGSEMGDWRAGIAEEAPTGLSGRESGEKDDVEHGKTPGF